MNVNVNVNVNVCVCVYVRARCIFESREFEPMSSAFAIYFCINFTFQFQASMANTASTTRYVQHPNPPIQLNINKWSINLNLMANKILKRTEKARDSRSIRGSISPGRAYLLTVPTISICVANSGAITGVRARTYESELFCFCTGDANNSYAGGCVEARG